MPGAASVCELQVTVVRTSGCVIALQEGEGEVSVVCLGTQADERQTINYNTHLLYMLQIYA